MHINNIGCFAPSSVTAFSITSFYAGVILDARMRLASNQPRLRRLHYVYGMLSLAIESTESLDWRWVVYFAEQMVSLVRTSHMLLGFGGNVPRL